MKALSLRQPWAAAVLHLGKVIENRRWNTAFRGEFLIHAAKGMTRAEHAEALDFCEDVLGLPRCFEIADKLQPPRLRFGGIVGIATLVSVVHPRSDLLPIEGQYPKAIYESDAWRWHMAEQYGFVLENVRELPFVPYRGELGFFEIPRSVVAGLPLSRTA
jgi:hypothetical protein